MNEPSPYASVERWYAILKHGLEEGRLARYYGSENGGSPIRRAIGRT
jgi:hypothetical protein